jgi:metal-responsive CopG/Arc/MetJ family transcriptional regulator
VIKGNAKNVYLPSPIWKLIDQIAERTGSTRSSIIRYAVLRYVEELGLLNDIMKASFERASG